VGARKPVNNQKAVGKGEGARLTAENQRAECSVVSDARKHYGKTERGNGAGRGVWKKDLPCGGESEIWWVKTNPAQPNFR